MDCDVAAAFDHVSHHVIIDAMEALKVPPVSAAWIRAYSRSETFVKLDDITTPGIRRIRSMPIFWQQHFVKGARRRSGSYHWEGDRAFYFSRTTAGLSQFRQRNSNAWPRAWNELPEEAGLRIAWEEPVWCSSAPDSLEATNVVDDTVITRRRREQGFKALGAWITFAFHERDCGS